MAEVTRFVFNDDEIRRLQSPAGELGRVIIGLGDQVALEAIANASGRPGPMIRSGDLVEKVETVSGSDDQGFYVDVGSSSEHRGYQYPSRLETGEDGPHYPWLVPALEEVIQRF